MEPSQEHAVISMPRIGDAAPEFKAVTTQGDINFPADSLMSLELRLLLIGILAMMLLSGLQVHVVQPKIEWKTVK